MNVCKETKTRLAMAMEANGVTEVELKTTLENCDVIELGYGNFLDMLIKRLQNDEDMLRKASGYTIMSLALLCNVSTDYLLGMSDTMNYIG